MLRLAEALHYSEDARPCAFLLLVKLLFSLDFSRFFACKVPIRRFAVDFVLHDSTFCLCSLPMRLHSFASPRLAVSLSLAALLALLTGCATDQSAQKKETSFWRPHTELVDEQMVRYRAESERIGDRLRAACVSPKFKAYFAKTACLPSGITEKMTADRTKITAAQKRAALEVFKLSHALSEEMRNFMVNTGLPELIDRAETSRRVTDPLIEDLQQRLLAGKITWGQYNTERQSLAERAREEANKTNTSDNNSLTHAAPASEKTSSK